MRGTNARSTGFTLLELSVVLALIAVMVAGGLVILVGYSQAAAVNTTIARMDAINAALLNYRVAFNRLPCPADLTLPASSVNYGVEAGAGSGSAIAAATGACTGTGMLPQANFTGAQSGGDTVAEGAVPTRALRLPDSAMYDAWNRHFRYAVDGTMTAANAFSTTTLLPPTCATPAISVTDASGTASSRTNSGVYALISHGANGHGAYTSNGTVIGTGSVNASEQTNCHCNSAGANTGYSPTYVEKLATVDAANALDNFDDFVTFRALWQVQTPAAFSPVAGGCTYLAVSTYTPPYIYLYQFANGTLTPQPAPATAPSGWSFHFDFNHDNSKLVYVDAYGVIWVYNVTSGGLVYNNSYTTGVGGNTGNQFVGFGAAGWGFLSPDNGDTYLAFPTWDWNGSAMTGLFAYQNNGGSYIYNNWVNISPAPSSPGALSAAWNSTGSTVYFADSNCIIYAFTPSGASFSAAVQLNASSAYGGVCPYDIALHPSGNYLEFLAGWSQYIIQLPLSSSPASPLVYAQSTVTGYALAQSAWSPDGNYLAEQDWGSGSSFYVQYFNPVAKTLTPLPVNYGSSSCIGNGATKPAWSKDSSYIAVVASNGTLCLYQRSGSGSSASFTNVTIPAPPPNQPTGVAFTH